MVGFFRAFGRMIWFGLAVTFYLTKYFLYAIRHGSDPDYAMEIRFRFVRGINKVFGIHIRQKGNIPDEKNTYLIVCNHRNLVDPLIVLQYIKAWPVAKAEVAKYPFIGFGAKVTGVIYVKRENKTSRRNTRAAIAEGLNDGKNILIFPEGTVSTDETTIEFKPGSFEVAAEEGFPVYPAVIEYKNKERDYWNNKSLFGQYFNMFASSRIDAYMSFGEPITGNSGIDLMNSCRQWMDTEIIRIHREWNEV